VKRTTKGTEGAGDQGEEHVGGAILPAMVWLPGDPFEDIRCITTAGMEYALRLKAGGGSGPYPLTGSIAGFMLGTFQVVYYGTQAFIDSFSFALRNELQDTGVTVTCLIPGATETEFFERADVLDTKVGQQEKDDPANVAKTGFDATMKGEGDVVSGWKNKLQSAIANVTPASTLAARHRKMAELGSDKQ
jgi:NAD(P)-dependent dehydrogenase (short-subunit alcohol dehydrogenase family)